MLCDRGFDFDFKGGAYVRCISTFMVLALFFGSGSSNLAFCAQDASSSVVETASGPAGLLELEQQGKITVRALRAWGRLPDKDVQLGQKLHQEAGLDLLAADLNQINAWISQGEQGGQGNTTLSKVRDGLVELAVFMENGEYLDWTAAADETQLPAGALVRKNGHRWVHGSGEPAASPAVAPTESVLARYDFTGVESPEWLPYAINGGKFNEYARYEAGYLLVAVPEGGNTRTTGLSSATPFVSLPKPDDTESLRIRLAIDSKRSSNVVFALIPPEKVGKHDWNSHELWLAFEERKAGVQELSLASQGTVQARIPLPSAEDLDALEMLIRPDGVVLVTGKHGRILLEGRRAAVPRADAYHVQISASATLNVATSLALKSLAIDRVPYTPSGNPAAVLGNAAQEVALFDGRTLGPYFEPFTPRGVVFPDVAQRTEDGLLVSLPKEQGRFGAGLFAPEALIWLDRFSAGGSVRLVVEIDPERTSGFQITLASPLAKSGYDPGKPRYVLHWRKTVEGTLRASHWLDDKTGLVEATPLAMPEQVELELTPAGIRVLASGFPDDVLPWGELVDGQGFRLFVTAKADAAKQPATMALRKIRLIRTPAIPVAAPKPQAGVVPLAITPLFPAAQGTWEPYDLTGIEVSDSLRFDNQGSLIVDKAAKYQHPRAGILSSSPVAELDERLLTTPYRLTLHFDRNGTDGFQVLLSNHKVVNMEKQADLQVSLMRQMRGLRPDDWVMTLTAGYWPVWTRILSAEDMAAWDGQLVLDISPGVVSAALPGLIRMRGTGFSGLHKGITLYMTAHSDGPVLYGAARMMLTGVSGGWVTPDGMTARQRLVLQDTEDFDAGAYLDLLNEEVLRSKK